MVSKSQKGQSKNKGRDKDNKDMHQLPSERSPSERSSIKLKGLYFDFPLSNS